MNAAQILATNHLKSEASHDFHAIARYKLGRKFCYEGTPCRGGGRRTRQRLVMHTHEVLIGRQIARHERELNRRADADREVKVDD